MTNSGKGLRACADIVPRIVPGDHLFVEFRGREPLHVYVLSEDEAGAITALFPVAGTELANPLAPGLAHRLPGPRGGEEIDWVVTSHGGRDHVLVVASRTRIELLEQEVARREQATAGREVSYAPVPVEALTRLRGIAGLAPAPAAGRAGHLEGIVRALEERRSPGVWARLTVLENPSP
jgi:hypothetical protein